MLDAARTLGASERRVFRRVLMPQAAPGVLAGTVLAFARALGEFGATLMLAGNIPGRTQTMPIAIFSAVESGDMRIAFVWVSLIVILSLAIIRLLNLQSRTSRPARSRSAAAVPMAFVGHLDHRRSQLARSSARLRPRSKFISKRRWRSSTFRSNLLPARARLACWEPRAQEKP